jgi:hypothetical protein
MFANPAVSFSELVADIVRLLPEYVPGMETGPAASTESRSCWIKTWKGLLTVLGREHGMDVVTQEEGDSALQRQLTMFWKRGNGILVAFYSGWGDRQDMERRFQQLESLKAPQKVILFSCFKWQEAVIEQLEAALLGYPYHIQGEQYLALNFMGPSQSLNAHLFTVSHHGSLSSGDLKKLTPMPGGPFSWRDARKRTALSH